MCVCVCVGGGGGGTEGSRAEQRGWDDGKKQDQKYGEAHLKNIKNSTQALTADDP